MSVFGCAVAGGRGLYVCVCAGWELCGALQFALKGGSVQEVLQEKNLKETRHFGFRGAIVDCVLLQAIDD
jgi:hypothetical protein